MSVLAVPSEMCSVYCFSSDMFDALYIKGVLYKAVNSRRDMLSQLQRSYDSKDTGHGFLAMSAATILSTSRACRTAFLEIKGPPLTGWSLKFHPRFMVCGSKAFKGHRRAFDSWFIWIIIKIMPFGPLDSDGDCMAYGFSTWLSSVVLWKTYSQCSAPKWLMPLNIPW